jgi:hypothetical protein
MPFLRSFNLAVRCVSRALSAWEDGGTMCGLEPTAVAAVAIDREHWIHFCWALDCAQTVAGAGVVKRRLGIEGLK